ncbi:MAG: hypothetical protein M1546_14310 [Chloroflexi bacterium]|nr:hypothetical protein [Chloroflexota bacterium]
MIVQEPPGREVVVGAVGQFWRLNIPFAEVKPDEFRAFHQPGWGKPAWAIAVEPFATGSTVSFELRTGATDEERWRELNRYYAAISPASHLIRESVMAHLGAVLGKLERPHDEERPLPGDELAPAEYSLTFGTDIEAPAPIVWGYLMQLGCDRAGWCSVDQLDHGGVPSVDHLVRGWETRRLGD